jgi:FkbM family methyltransferase
LRVIYDFGSNNGDDIPYYLKKSDTVVAVEANPALCEKIANRFDAEIKSGRLFIENCILNTDRNTAKLDFYIHKFDHVLSQFPKPDECNIANFQKILLPSLTPFEIINKYGPPHYIKIDVERYDHEILRHLFNNSIFPPFISAESHSLDVFCLLVACGKYKAFKLVEGNSVSKLYNNATIMTDSGTENYSFPHHSAGPFGDDIKGKWMTSVDLMRHLALEGLGWKDIHATSVINAGNDGARSRSFLKKVMRRTISNILPLLS